MCSHDGDACAAIQPLTLAAQVIAAEKDIFGGGARTAVRARNILPGCEAEVLPGARHCFSSERMGKVHYVDVGALVFSGPHGLPQFPMPLHVM